MAATDEHLGAGEQTAMRSAPKALSASALAPEDAAQRPQESPAQEDADSQEGQRSGTAAAGLAGAHSGDKKALPAEPIVVVAVPFGRRGAGSPPGAL
jgi:hypothetical protein